MSFRSIDKQALVLLGAGGHAKVVLALARACGYQVVGVCDPGLAAGKVTSWQGVPVLGGDDALAELDPDKYGLINGIGQMPRQCLRQKLYDRNRAKGFVFPLMVHPAAWVAEDAQLADGVQVMAGAVLQPGCSVGANSIINTKAGIDHDCRIGAQVHVAPGATLSGGVCVEDSVFIGAGATLIQGVSIGRAAILGAGVACLGNIDAGKVFVNEAYCHWSAEKNN